jgi:adenosylcobinamide-phosphate synthase
MTLAVLLAALLLDRYRPLTRPSRFDRELALRAVWLREHLDAGTARAGFFAWLAGALAPALLVGLLLAALGRAAPALAWAAGVALLYFAGAYRHAAEPVADMVGALTVADLERARRFCGATCADLAEDADADSLARRAAARLFGDALERLFAPIFWFVCLGGFGLALDILTRSLARAWEAPGAFGAAARQAQAVLDWLPARALALSFAIVGHFDRALSAWRGRANWARGADLVAGAGVGALGWTEAAPAGHDPRAAADSLEGALNLIWRALLLWLGAFALAWLAGR